MAKPIKSTPTLYGKDAERFLKQMKENMCKKATSEQLAEIKKGAEAMKAIIKKAKL